MGLIQVRLVRGSIDCCVQVFIFIFGERVLNRVFLDFLDFLVSLEVLVKWGRSQFVVRGYLQFIQEGLYQQSGGMGGLWWRLGLNEIQIEVWIRYLVYGIIFWVGVCLLEILFNGQFYLVSVLFVVVFFGQQFFELVQGDGAVFYQGSVGDGFFIEVVGYNDVVIRLGVVIVYFFLRFYFGSRDVVVMVRFQGFTGYFWWVLDFLVIEEVGLQE